MLPSGKIGNIWWIDLGIKADIYWINTYSVVSGS